MTDKRSSVLRRKESARLNKLEEGMFIIFEERGSIMMGLVYRVTDQNVRAYSTRPNTSGTVDSHNLTQSQIYGQFSVTDGEVTDINIPISPTLLQNSLENILEGVKADINKLPVGSLVEVRGAKKYFVVTDVTIIESHDPDVETYAMHTLRSKDGSELNVGPEEITNVVVDGHEADIDVSELTEEGK